MHSGKRVNHVILKEFYVDRQVPYFVEYNKAYTDMPHLVKVEKADNGYEMGRLLRACDTQGLCRHRQSGVEICHVGFRNYDKPSVVHGGMGFRYPKKEESHGKWNIAE